ncbi:ABC transporter ATP-binding protein [Paenibacillus sp. p3-SID1389]|uniref:ABC transporter ATP-binding protein n=1 Tax=Paenibacillus sp. p3-SID1389 TaxID=2916364 RepID=UPI0021A681F7|nr:ABC transporter ATP-binding protein [Paenibacillus sp. p3-SID1389]MCT2195829.1 ABC transporter ATP-binding protein [Paenibacillus sp. p3-SID1389]
MQPVITFRHFSFRYKNQSEPTLKNIHLEIARGEKIWIAGPSGSGKSTLAHCINGLIPFSYGGEVSGQLLLEGQDASAMTIFERSRRVGTILQNPDAQFVGQTVGEDVAFQLENEATPQDVMKEAVFSALDLVGMRAFEARGPHELSGGQKQQVSLAGVLSTQADILLFDEPLANLDPASGAKAMRLIDEIHRNQGKTVILIEHRAEDVLLEHIDRVIVMNEGEIAAIGMPDELLAAGILPQYGLRQPLYLDALCHAGLSLSNFTGLTDPAALRLQEHVVMLDGKGEGNEQDDSERMKDDRQRTGGSEPQLRERLETWAASVPLVVRGGVGEPLLELRGVSFAYEPGTNAVEDVSLTVRAGETVALLGSNGAGKSTLSGLITGLLKPSKGEMRLSGEVINDWSIRRRGEAIGYVMQHPHHMLTQHIVRDEVRIGLAARGVPEPERGRRADEALRICGLYPYRNWPVSALSFGQKKRLSIAAILALQPKLMILDEPTAGQDYRHYTEFMEFIARLAAEGMAFLFITHDMHLALEYADRAAVMAGGRIIAEDTVARILADGDLTARANLRETSLARFAKAQGLTSPSRFVEAFIAAEKKVKRA